MSRYLYPHAVLRATGALRLAGLAGVRAPTPHQSEHCPERRVPVAGCGCRVEGRAVALCALHFAELAGESR